MSEGTGSSVSPAVTYSSSESTPCSFIFWSTRLRRAPASFGLERGEKAEGEEMIPASSAASSGASSDEHGSAPPSPQPGYLAPK
jgi:hypothetical protein